MRSKANDRGSELRPRSCQQERGLHFLGVYLEGGGQKGAPSKGK